MYIYIYTHIYYTSTHVYMYDICVYMYYLLYPSLTLRPPAVCPAGERRAPSGPASPGL